MIELLDIPITVRGREPRGLTLGTEITSYYRSLEYFIVRDDLPVELFRPFDHIALKVASLDDLNRMAECFRPAAVNNEIYRTEIDGRFVDVVHLSGQLAVGSFGSVDQIEIIQKKPDRERDFEGLEHAEVHVPDLYETERILYDKKIDYRKQSNRVHSTLSLRLNFARREFKFTDTGMAEFMAKEISTGTAKLL